MASIPGTVLAGKVSPGDTNTTFPTHEDLYGKGGLVSLSSLTVTTTGSEPERLPRDRQKEGMIIYDQDTNKYYTLTAVSTNQDIEKTYLFDVDAQGRFNVDISNSRTQILSGGIDLAEIFDTARNLFEPKYSSLLSSQTPLATGLGI